MTHLSINRCGAFALGFILSLSGAAALANSWNRTPGYEWGRNNCGPATGNRRSYASCVSCCMSGAQNENYPADEAGGCNHFCKRVPWQIWMAS